MPKQAFENLIQDHREAEKLLQELIDACQKGSVPETKLEKCQDALQTHMKIEEEYLYPEARKEQDAKDLIKDGIEEHQEVKDLLKRIKADAEPKELGKILEEVLKDVKHHAGEEEKELFPRLQKKWDEEKIADITEKMDALKKRELAKH